MDDPFKYSMTKKLSTDHVNTFAVFYKQRIFRETFTKKSYFKTFGPCEGRTMRRLSKKLNFLCKI